MHIDTNATALPVWTINITDTTTPLWFYCAQTNPAPHCEKGMVFAVNPTADKTFAAFQQSAMNGTAAASAAGGNSTDTASSGAAPASTAAPTDAGAGGAAPPVSGSGFATSFSPPTAASASTETPNSAVGLSSAGAVSFMSLFATVAGFML
jgi:hypothetical protein